MTAIDSVIEAMGPNRKRLVWLPSLTLGYLFHLTGFSEFFWLAIAAAGGANVMWGFVSFLTDEKWKRTGENRGVQYLLGHIPQGTVRRWILGIVLALYAFSIVRSMLGLYRLFDHTDLILVGLGLIWWISLVTVFANGYSLLRKPSWNEPVTPSDLNPLLGTRTEKFLEKYFQVTVGER